MQDDNRIFLSDSLKDIIDLEEKPQKIEFKSNKLIFNIIKTQYSSNKIFSIITDFEEKKNKIIIKSLIQNINLEQLISENILEFKLTTDTNENNIIKYFSCENYNIYKKLKKINENNYILILKVKEIKDE
jgi:hypothetical protein